MFLKIIITAAAIVLSAPGTAAAASPEGIWVTEPDRKGGYAHIQAHRCGRALCGKVLRAFDREGREIITPAVGKRVFWDMRPVEGGGYEGRAWVPAYNSEFNGTMRLSGGRLTVGGCAGPICRSQVWRRIK